MTSQISIDQKLKNLKKLLLEFVDVKILDENSDESLMFSDESLMFSDDMYSNHSNWFLKETSLIKTDKGQIIIHLDNEVKVDKRLLIESLKESEVLSDISNINLNFGIEDIDLFKELNALERVTLNVTNESFTDLLCNIPPKCKKIMLVLGDDIQETKPIKIDIHRLAIENSNFTIKDINFLINCKNITHLSMCNVSDIAIINSISNLVSLKELSLFRCIVKLNPLNKLKKLRVLNLHSTELNEVLNLKLTKLTIFGNNSFDINNIDITKLEFLTLVLLDDINISNINTASNLRLLFIRSHFFNNNNKNHNKKLDITDALNCINLANLRIDGCEVVYDPLDLIENKSLKLIELNQCGLENIDFLEKYPNLEVFNATENKIQDISILAKINPINHIKLELCNVLNIPSKLNTIYEIGTSEQDKVPCLNLNKNPLENPPIEMLAQGKEALNSYFDSMKGETENLNEAKIIFLGGGEVGKTSLMKKIVGEDFNKNENPTHGINIKPYSVKISGEEIVNASIWDFGGQQIMHATHQLFLSRRCVYVLVIEDRKDDLQKDQKIDYWLQQIYNLGSDSKVLIVKNKFDLFEHNNLKESELRDKFPNIVFIDAVSCETGYNIDKFKTAINDQIKRLPMRQIKLSKNWIKIKEEIKKLSHERDHVSLCAFEEICNNNQLTDKNAIKTLRQLLHDLSIIIAFPELDAFDMGILNPHWITDGIYSIINSKLLARKNGYIKEAEAQSVLDIDNPSKYTNKARFIIEAMIQFELCHQVGSSRTKAYLVPNLLPTEIKNRDINRGENTIRFVFKYENLLPPSIFPKFLVRLNQDIQANKRWRTGAILADSTFNVQAKVEENTTEKSIYIEVSGRQARDYFSTIRKTINDLNATFNINKLGVIEYIPLPTIGGNFNDMVSYNELIGHEIEDKKTYFNGRLRREFNVSELLSGIEPKESTTKSIEQLSKGTHVINNITLSNDSVLNNTVNQEQSQKQISTQSVDIKIELKGFQGTATNVLTDIIDEAESEFNGSDDFINIKKECDKVNVAVEALQEIETPEHANKNPHLFSRISDFLQGALNKENSTGQVIELLGNTYTEVQGLAKKYNKIASFFGMPTVPDILL